MQFDTDIFFQQLLSSSFLKGAWISISLAVVSQVGAIVLGAVLAAAKLSRSGLARGAANTYLWFFRAIPTLLVLLLVWNAAPQAFPVLRQDWYSPFVAAFFALALAEAAFMAEIIRSALLSIDEGQTLAARALGMGPARVLRTVVLPQATRIALPPTGNEFIGMVKYTSLASVISLKELLTTAQMGVSATFRFAEYYAAATVYYLVIVSVLMVVQNQVERRFQWSTKVARPARQPKKVKELL